MREEKKKDNTNEKKGVSFEALSSLDAPVSFWKGIPFGLQHVMAMFVANLAPIFLVASAANMSAEQSATIFRPVCWWQVWAPAFSCMACG
ncbi:MAG: hypothetical protein ACLS6O_08030 [Bifidobacterium sp.]